LTTAKVSVRQSWKASGATPHLGSWSGELLRSDWLPHTEVPMTWEICRCRSAGWLQTSSL